MNTRKTRFVPEPRHAMDLKAQKQMAQAINSLLNSQIVAGKKNQAHHSDSNTIYEFNAASTQYVDYFPFKIYQPSQSSLLTTQGQTIVGTVFDGTGTPSMAVIDSNNPTDETATPPTYNPTTDYWRFWFVRDGIVETRPYYSALLVGGSSDSGNGALTVNNFAYQEDVYWGTDGIQNPYDDPTTGYPNQGSFTNQGLENGYQDAYLYNGVIIINGDSTVSESQDPPNYFFWLEITPDQNNQQLPLTRIKGKRFSYNPLGDPYYSAPMLAYSPFLIPIGSLEFGANGTVFDPTNPTLSQLIYNHAIFRWPTAFTPTTPATGAAQIMAAPTQAQLYSTPVIAPKQYRGNWGTDAVIQTMMFYPGDEVIMTTTGNLVTCVDSVTSAAVYGDATVDTTYCCIAPCFLAAGSSPDYNENFIQVASAITSISSS